MADRNQPVLDFLLSRRSRPAKLLQAPAPDRTELREILTAAARSPDHGKLEPWRFIVLEAAAMPRLADVIAKRGAALGKSDADIQKACNSFTASPLAVAVVTVPRSTEKIPQIEQTLSAGAVCLALLNAALAAGWGANWLSGWASHDAGFLSEGLGLAPGETVAAFIHIGSTDVAPPDRPRPDIEAITEWVEA